jgi:hypothetical protein
VSGCSGSGYATLTSHPAGSVQRMNPDRHRAAQLRRQALRDQIEGLERWVAAGRTEPHVVDRLAHTRAELVTLDSLPARQLVSFGDTPVTAGRSIHRLWHRVAALRLRVVCSLSETPV